MRDANAPPLAAQHAQSVRNKSMSNKNNSVEYRDIPEFPGYRVGDDGTLWSRWKKKRLGQRKGCMSFLSETWRQLSGHRNQKGYIVVALRRNNRNNDRKLHHLVLGVFVGPCPENMEACHRNGIADDNRLCNLRWDTHTSNLEDRRLNGTHPVGANNPKAKLTDENIKDIRQQYSSGEANQFSLAEKYGVAQTCISSIVRRKSWAHIP